MEVLSWSKETFIKHIWTKFWPHDFGYTRTWWNIRNSLLCMWNSTFSFDCWPSCSTGSMEYFYSVSFNFLSFSQVPTMRVPVQLMPTWMPMQLQGLHPSISLLLAQPFPGRLLLMLPDRPSWWVLLAMRQYLPLAPRRGNGSSMGNRKNRVLP